MQKDGAGMKGWGGLLVGAQNGESGSLASIGSTDSCINLSNSGWGWTPKGAKHLELLWMVQTCLETKNKGNKIRDKSEPSLGMCRAWGRSSCAGPGGVRLAAGAGSGGRTCMALSAGPPKHGAWGSAPPPRRDSPDTSQCVSYKHFVNLT